MQTIILYLIGALAIGYFAMTIWKQVKGKDTCACSTGQCGGCGSGSANNCK